MTALLVASQVGDLVTALALPAGSERMAVGIAVLGIPALAVMVKWAGIVLVLEAARAVERRYGRGRAELVAFGAVAGAVGFGSNLAVVMPR